MAKRDDLGSGTQQEEPEFMGFTMPEPYTTHTRFRVIDRQDEAYKQALKQGSLLVSYAGLMMVGPGGIGKSSLLCGLKNQPLPDEASSTLMADCHTITSASASRPSKSSWKSSKGNSFWKDVTEEEEYIEMARFINQVLKSTKKKKLDAQTKSRLYSSDFQRNDVRQIIKKVFEYIPEIEDSVLESEHWIRVWDCGGQKVFRTILPAFITPRTIFFLLFDARNNLDNRFESHYNHPGSDSVSLAEDLTVLELMLKWMAMIHASLGKKSNYLKKSKSRGSFAPYPRIIPVGTHGDDEYVKSNSEEITRSISEACVRKSFASIVEECIIVDNTKAGHGASEDPNYDTIRKRVGSFAAKLTCDTPISWVLFRKVISQLSKKKPVAILTEIHEAALACSIPTSDVKSVLQFYHSFGVFFHYSHIPSLKNKVIIDPQWLVKVIATLFPLHNSSKTGTPHMHLLRQFGLLVPPLYEELLGQQKFLKAQEIIDLLSDFLIIAEIHTSSKMHDCEKEYFAPCMLSNTSNSDETSQKQPLSYVPEPLQLVFSTNYLPPGFFTRFAAVLSKNPKFEVLFDEISSKKIRYAFGKKHERAQELTIIESVLSVQINVTQVAERNYQEFFYSCCEIIKEIRLCSEEALQWLPQVKMSLAIQCKQCKKANVHFTILPPTLATTQQPCLRCQNDRLCQLTSEEDFWISVIKNDPHILTIQGKGVEIQTQNITTEETGLETFPSSEGSHHMEGTETETPQTHHTKSTGAGRVNSDQLSDVNLREVMETVHEASANWCNIGIALELSYNTLEGIESSPGSTDDHFRKMLVTWLRTGHKRNWRALANAMGSSLVKRPDLKEKILGEKCQ